MRVRYARGWWGLGPARAPAGQPGCACTTSPSAPLPTVPHAPPAASPAGAWAPLQSQTSPPAPWRGGAWQAGRRTGAGAWGRGGCGGRGVCAHPCWRRMPASGDCQPPRSAVPPNLLLPPPTRTPPSLVEPDVIHHPLGRVHHRQRGAGGVRAGHGGAAHSLRRAGGVGGARVRQVGRYDVPAATQPLLPAASICCWLPLSAERSPYLQHPPPPLLSQTDPYRQAQLVRCRTRRIQHLAATAADDAASACGARRRHQPCNFVPAAAVRACGAGGDGVRRRRP